MANVLVDGAVNATTSTAHYPNALVFVNDTVGYQFYIDNGSDIAYKKTTDSGATWGTKQIVEAGTMVCMSIHHGKWSNASTPDNLIHIAYLSSAGVLKYISLDPDNSDTLSTAIQLVDGENSGSTTASVGICQNSDKKVVVFFSINNVRLSIYKSNTAITSFSACAATALTLSLNNRWYAIAPHPTTAQDIVLIQADDTNGDLTATVYDESADSWATPVDIDTAIDYELGAGYESVQIAAVLNLATDQIVLIARHRTSSTAGEIRCYSFDGTSWTTETNVYSYTTAATEAMGVALGVNNTNGAVYAAYTMGTAQADTDVLYKITTDDGTTWSSATSVCDTIDDNRHVWITSAPQSSVSRIAVGFNNVDLVDIYFQDIGVTVTTVTQTVTAKGRVKQAGTTKTVTAKAKVKFLQEKTVQAEARVLRVFDQTIQALGRVQKLITQTVTAKAAIQGSTEQTQTVDALARIQKLLEQTLQAKAKVKFLQEKTIDAKARVSNASTTKTVTAKAKVLHVRSTSVDAQARVQFLFDQTIDALARVKQLTAKTVQAQARIRKSRTLFIQADYRAKHAAVTATVQAQASVLFNVEETIEALARVVQLMQQTVTARAYILSTSVTVDVDAMAKILQVYPVTIDAQGRIKKTASVFLTGEYLAQFLQTQTIQALAEILKLETRTMSAKAYIAALLTQTSQGKAFVVPVGRGFLRAATGWKHAQATAKPGILTPTDGWTHAELTATPL